MAFQAKAMVKTVRFSKSLFIYRPYPVVIGQIQSYLEQISNFCEKSSNILKNSAMFMTNPVIVRGGEARAGGVSEGGGVLG